MNYYAKQVVTVKSISRHVMPFCHSKQLFIVVVTEDGTNITVPWTKMPMVVTFPSIATKPTFSFDWFWYNIEIGKQVYLIHGNDQFSNYLERIDN